MQQLSRWRSKSCLVLETPNTTRKSIRLLEKICFERVESLIFVYFVWYLYKVNTKVDIELTINSRLYILTFGHLAHNDSDDIQIYIISLYIWKSTETV